MRWQGRSSSFAGLAALPAGLRAAGAEEPASPVAYGDVSAATAAPDAPLLLQLRFEADGRVGLRSALTGAATLAWTDRATVNLGAAAPEAQADALRALHGALLAAQADAMPVPLRAPDGSSSARVIVDAHPEALWRHVQWALASAASPDLKLWRLTFVGAPDAPRLDVELPTGPGGASGPGARAGGGGEAVPQVRRGRRRLHAAAARRAAVVGGRRLQGPGRRAAAPEGAGRRHAAGRGAEGAGPDGGAASARAGRDHVGPAAQLPPPR